MSILPPEIHAALTQLLQGLSSADNDARTFAEEQLNTTWVAAQPDVLLMGLVELLGVAHEPSVSIGFNREWHCDHMYQSG